MKNILIALLMIVVISCTDDNGGGGSKTKPISGQIPSDNKSVLEGIPIVSGAEVAEVNVAKTPRATEYFLIDRLFDTVWFQSEEDIDDGVVEVETEFLFFKKIDGVVRLDEIEMENGVIDPPDGDNEYSILTDMDNTSVDPTNLNAFIALNIEFENGAIDEAEYEGYYLRDNRTLYVIDDDTKLVIIAKLKAMIAITDDAQLELIYNDDRYLLSEQPDIGEIIPNTTSQGK